MHPGHEPHDEKDRRTLSPGETEVTFAPISRTTPPPAMVMIVSIRICDGGTRHHLPSWPRTAFGAHGNLPLAQERSVWQTPEAWISISASSGCRESK